MESETAKLPKGQSYPLKPLILKAALTNSHVNIHTHLVRSSGKVFEANFWLPNSNVPYERLYIRVGSVPAEQVQAARNRVECVTLPALIEWITNILAQDLRSPIRREKQRIVLERF